VRPLNAREQRFAGLFEAVLTDCRLSPLEAVAVLGRIAGPMIEAHALIHETPLARAKELYLERFTAALSGSLDQQTERCADQTDV
jgi:hypothetical protein